MLPFNPGPFPRGAYECAGSLHTLARGWRAQRGPVPSPHWHSAEPPQDKALAELASSCGAVDRLLFRCPSTGLDMAPFVKKASVPALLQGLPGPPLACHRSPSWPQEPQCWHAGGSGLFQPRSDHALSPRDFPGNVPSLEPAGLSQGFFGFPPWKPKLLLRVCCQGA